MSKVKTKIPSGSLTLLTKPNAAGECAVYMRNYLGSYIKKSAAIAYNNIADKINEKYKGINIIKA